MIQHASIPADDPKSVVQVLARIFGGEVTTFPPGGPDAWMAWSKDGTVQIEVTRRGRCLIYDTGKFNWTTDQPPVRHSEVHLGIFIDKPEPEILAIAKEAGWPAQHSDRAGGQFGLAEVWVEGVFLLEFIDPEQAIRLKRAVTVQNWRRVFPS